MAITHNIPFFERHIKLAVVWAEDPFFVNESVVIGPSSKTNRVERPSEKLAKSWILKILLMVFIHNGLLDRN